MTNLQVNKLKSGIKNCTEVTLKLSLIVVDDSNDEKSFPHKLLLTNTQVTKLLTQIFTKLLQIFPQLI